MNRKLWQVGFLVVLTVLLASVAVAVAQDQIPQQVSVLNIPEKHDPVVPFAAAQTEYTYTTAITVTSGTDPDTNKSYTCSSPPADGLCTLRRAIVESRSMSAGELPVLIRFDIPQDPSEGYDSNLQIWKIQVHSTTDTAIFRRVKGQVIIDGGTQPGGRSEAEGPKIFIVGPDTGQKDGLIIGDVAGDDNIEIHGIGFQNLKTHLYVNTDSNIIENNWFGLDDDGTGPYLRNGEPEDGSGNAGISLSSGSMNNVIRNNVFLGFDGVAAAIRGEGNLFENNLVGTRADGSLTKNTQPGQTCTTVDWLGGGGISVSDERNRIENNVFAGLRQEIFQISTQPDAIRIDGDEHIVLDNTIGVDSTAAEVGVCGRGIYLAGANSPDHTQVMTNTIVNPEMSAISINGVLVDANTLQNNIIKKATDWPQIEGNPEPEDAIQFGATVPDALKDFKPAQVTSIDETTVSGTSGSSSPCPNCIIELYLDDVDTVTEALQLLAVAKADSSGNWTTTIPFELGNDQGLRTTSTTAQFNTISNMNAGTTTKLSELYVSAHQVFLPLVLR